MDGGSIQHRAVGNINHIVSPPEGPQTKPDALTHALTGAVVIPFHVSDSVSVHLMDCIRRFSAEACESS